MFNSDSLPGNPHAQIATSRLGETPRPLDSAAEQLHFGSEANAQATLALAYEVRTLNLLLHFRHVDRQGDLPDLWIDLAKQVNERLGELHE